MKRADGAPLIDNPDGGRDAAYFHAANCGKTSIVADFRDAVDREGVQALIRDADVLIEISRSAASPDTASTMAALPRKSGLVYCSITGFGQDGAYAHRAGYDFIVQDMSVIIDLGPIARKIRVAVADIMTSHAVIRHTTFATSPTASDRVD